MSDSGSSRPRRKTRRAKRRALTVPLDDVPRTSAVAPPPAEAAPPMEASVEVEIDEEALADSPGVTPESNEAAAPEPPAATRELPAERAVTVAPAVMISEPPPPPKAVSLSEPPRSRSTTEEIELEEVPVEEVPVEEVPVEEVPVEDVPVEADDGDAVATGDDPGAADAPVEVDDLEAVQGEPEMTLGDEDDFDEDFEDGLEDVGELPGAPTVPGASLAELEAARREALGDVDAATETPAEAPSRAAATDSADAGDESELEADELTEHDLEEDDDIEDIDSGEIEVQAPPAPPSAPEAPPAPPKPPDSRPRPPDAPAAEIPQRRRAWFENFFNDDYLRTVRAPMARQVARQCDFIVDALGLQPGATLLDVGCGLGLHAIELTARGYLVVGLDLSLPMLSRASDEAQDRGLKINFLHGDMREMTFEGAFDAVLSWGTSFGYFDDETNRRVARRMRNALKPGGKLLLDVTNRDHVLATQPNLVWFEGDGCVVMEETSLNYFSSRLQVKRTVILDDGRQRDTRYSIRLYALHELGQLLHQEGFRVSEVSGLEATRGVFFGAASPRLLVLAERRTQVGSGGPSRPSEPGMAAVPGADKRPPDGGQPGGDAPESESVAVDGPAEATAAATGAAGAAPQTQRADMAQGASEGEPESE